MTPEEYKQLLIKHERMREEHNARREAATREVLNRVRKRLECKDEWTPEMQSQGVGHTIAKITHVLRVDAIVQRVFKDCGCPGRIAWLNKLLPYKQIRD